MGVVSKMTWSVYQHWDPLKVCVVGRSYPPEFYSWITVPHVRSLFEKIAIETEEDYQNIIKKLQSFGVEVLRPELSTTVFVDGKFLPPPMTPRDYTVMIGNTFYENYSFNIVKAYQNVKDPSWPECFSKQEFERLPSSTQEECNTIHHFSSYQKIHESYNHIFDRIREQGNTIKSNYYERDFLNGAQVSRVGRDLYFGTVSYNQDTSSYKNFINKEFTNTRNHIVNTSGHSDGTYCPVCPGLIISLRDVPTYADTFPGWEVVYLPGQSWDAVQPFLALKNKNKGRWWIPGFEQDQAVIDVVETWLGHWTGYVEETVFDVNMLIVDPKNVIVFNYNKLVFDALERYGITPHIVPFRHRYFWDGGIHCVTSDLHREGTMQDYFPERKDV
jgi:glycine amidinotransferase